MVAFRLTWWRAIAAVVAARAAMAAVAVAVRMLPRPPPCRMSPRPRPRPMPPLLWRTSMLTGWRVAQCLLAGAAWTPAPTQTSAAYPTRGPARQPVLGLMAASQLTRQSEAAVLAAAAPAAPTRAVSGLALMRRPHLACSRVSLLHHLRRTRQSLWRTNSPTG
jgi:hypothetical protein